MLAHQIEELAAPAADVEDVRRAGKLRYVKLQAGANLVFGAPESILEPDVLVGVRLIPCLGAHRLADTGRHSRRLNARLATRQLAGKTLHLALGRRRGPLRDAGYGSQFRDGFENGTLFGVEERRDLLEELHEKLTRT